MAQGGRAVTGLRSDRVRALREVRRRGGNSRTVGIVGMTPVGVKLAERFRVDPTLGIRVVGFYDDRGDARQDTPECYEGKVGDFHQLIEDSKTGKLDLVYIALPLRAEERIAFIAVAARMPGARKAT